MSKQFESNIAIWAKERPVEAMRLQFASLDLPKWESKENLQMPYGLLYEKDAQVEVEDLDIQHAKALYIYGIGLGLYYTHLKKWLLEDAERHIFFLEDDYAVLHRFFETTLAKEILLNKQVSVCYINSLDDCDGVLETLYWSVVLTPFKVVALRSYSKNKATFFSELQTKISYDNTMKNGLVDEYMRYGAAFFRNFYPNMLELEGAYWGNALFGKFKGVPAIICGAGPSLGKQIERLGTLKDKALIFAGGSALNGLMVRDVLPHFGAGIDPNETQVLRLNESQHTNVPFFYRTRMLVEAARKIPGDRLYISGVGGYDIAEYYEKKFGLEAEFLDEGHNVVNFCTEIATRMGCNPIIFVGMDLAFTGMKAYTPGIDANEDLVAQDLLNNPDEEFRGIKRTDIFGEPILTVWKWIAESDWLSRFAKEHPEVTFINATEGGIGFQDIPNIPLHEVVKEHLGKQFPVQEKVKEEIKAAEMPQVTNEALKEVTVELKNSLKKCIEWIDVLLQEIKKEKTKPNTTGALTSGQAALAESDLYEEPAYIYLLDIFHQVFARVQNKKVTAIRLNKGEADEQAIAQIKLDLQQEKLQFIRNVAEANITLIDYALN